MTEKTFENFDKLNRRPFARQLTKAIKAHCAVTDDAYVLSLNAQFGSGKTTFLKMWQADLRDAGHDVVLLNAWETDFAEEPLVPIAMALLDALTQEPAAQKAKKALHGVLGIAALVGNTIIERTTGINTLDMMQKVESELKEDNLEKIGNELAKVFLAKGDIYRKLHETLLNYAKQLQNKPLIILVDELDRVRPDYAVKFLEAIKHIFATPGICFVLAVDRGQLSASVRQLYGAVDFDNYYRRFVTREAELPEPEERDWRAFSDQLAVEYFEKLSTANISFAFSARQKSSILSFAKEMCHSFQFTPRQAEHLFRIYSQFMMVEKPMRAEYFESWLRMSLFMIALHIKNKTKYDQIGLGKLSPRDLYNLVSNLRFSEIRGEQNKIYLINDSLAFLLSSNTANHYEICQVYRDTNGTSSDTHNDAILKELLGCLGGRVAGFGDITPFQTLYTKLENWRGILE